MVESERMIGDVVEWTNFPVESTLAHGRVQLTIGRAGAREPRALVSAGVHGDEGPWSALAIRRLLETTPVGDLMGSVALVPMANPLAVEADSRNAPVDGLNLNAVFPGRASGTYTERVARILTDEALRGVSVVLDCHGGGSWNINSFVYRLPGSEELAQSLGAPLILDGVDSSTTLVGYARALGAQAAWIEIGGRGAREAERVEFLASALKKALRRSGVLVGEGHEDQAVVVGSAKVALTTSCAGVYEPVLREDDLGSVVPMGCLVGRLLDPVTCEVIEEYYSPYDRSFVALLRPTLAVVEGAGKVVAMLARV